MKAREAIGALTAEVADLREENKKLLDQLVAAGFRNDELAQALQADPAVTHITESFLRTDSGIAARSSSPLSNKHFIPLSPSYPPG